MLAKMKDKIEIQVSRISGIGSFLPVQLIVGTLFLGFAAQAHPVPHNVVLYIADGLKPVAVTQNSAPTIYKKRGCLFF